MKTTVVAVVSLLLGTLIGIAAAPHLLPKRVFAQGIINPLAIPKVPPIDSAVPQVPPLFHISVGHSVFDGVAGAEARYVLDGLEMDGVRFDNPLGGITLAYGGGAYSLTNAVISGPLSLELTGAAANTAQLLDSFGLLLVPPTLIGGNKLGILTTVPRMEATTKTPQNKPIIKKLQLKKPLSGDISSQYDGTRK